MPNVKFKLLGVILLGSGLMAAAHAESNEAAKASAEKYQKQLIRNVEGIKFPSLSKFNKKMTSDYLKALNSPMNKRARFLPRASEETKKICVMDDRLYDLASHGILLDFQKAVESRKLADFLTKHLQKDGSHPSGWGAGVTQKKSVDAIEIVNWSAEKKGNPGVGLEEFVNSYSSVEYADLKTFHYRITQRSDAGMAPKEMDAKVWYDIRGAVGQLKRQDRGFVSIVFAEQNGQWKVKSIAPIEGETLTSLRQSAFEEITKIAGFDEVPVYLRREAIRRGGYGTAVGDFNNDGIVDIYTGAMGESVLLQGTAGGKFKKVPLQSVGLGADTMIKSAVFADINNDSFQDLILTQFRPNDEKSGILIYENNAGHFKALATPLSEKQKTSWPMPATVGDFNRDGYLDLYVGFPGKKDFTNFNRDLRNGLVPQGLYINNRKTSFTDQTWKYLWEKDYLAQEKTLYPHAAMAADFNLDGYMDVITMDDRGFLSPVYQNLNGEKFVESSAQSGVVNRGRGMGISMADFNNDGVMDIVMSNVNIQAAKRLHDSCQINWSVQVAPELLPMSGMRLFEGGKQQRYQDKTFFAGLDWAGDGLGGMAVIDYNNDGLMDLYVTNGLWSGASRAQALDSLFSQNVALSAIVPKVLNHEGAFEFMDLLIHSKLSPWSRDNGKAYKPIDGSLSLAGYQRNRLFRNNGDGTFTDVAFFEGVDSVADGYTAATVDLDKDGKMDLVLRNTDPGSEDYKFPTIQVFKNRSNQNKSLALRFEGTVSNRDAIGTTVVAKIGAQKAVQQLVANTGAIQSENVLVFGLGQSSKVDQLIINWASGQTEVFENVKAGLLKIKEKMNASIQGAL